MLNNFKLNEIRKARFSGFKTVRELFKDPSDLDKTKGVYLVLRLNKSEPKFLRIGSGPTLYKKKRAPNVRISVLRKNWVKNSIVLYIGKAGGLNKHGIEIKESLSKRIRKYLRFGKGKDVTHWGGRLIWQLKDYRDLIICWKSLPNDDPQNTETVLIEKFKKKFKKRPFANLKD